MHESTHAHARTKEETRATGDENGTYARAEAPDVRRRAGLGCQQRE